MLGRKETVFGNSRMPRREIWALICGQGGNLSISAWGCQGALENSSFEGMPPCCLFAILSLTET